MSEILPTLLGLAVPLTLIGVIIYALRVQRIAVLRQKQAMDTQAEMLAVARESLELQREHLRHLREATGARDADGSQPV